MERGRFKAPEPIEGEPFHIYFVRLVAAVEDHMNMVCSADLVPVTCDCTCAIACPQGQAGSGRRCTIMVRRK